MNTREEVAIILLNYNSYQDTIACIDSIRKSDCSVEIIVVDNASRENELAIIQEKYPIVKCIQSKTNGGFSAGNNLGIRYAMEMGYEYIMLLNNDTVIARDMIRQLKEYATDKSISVPKMFYYKEPRVIWYAGGDINRFTGKAEHRKMNQEDIDKERDVRKCTFATGCCMMVKTSVFRKVGLLDETYFMYCEDTEFCIRLVQKEISITYAPMAVLWHKVGSTTEGKDTPFSAYYMTRNRLNYLRQHKDYFRMTAYPYSLLTRYARALLYVAQGNSLYKSYLQGIRDHKKGAWGRQY